MYFSQNPFEGLCSFDDYIQEYFQKHPEYLKEMNHDFLYSFSTHLIDLAKSLLDSYDASTGTFDSNHESFRTVLSGLPKTLLFYAFLNNSNFTDIDFNKVLNKTLETLPHENLLAQTIQDFHESDTRHIFNLFNSSYYPAMNSSWTNDLFSNLSYYTKNNQEDT